MNNDIDMVKSIAFRNKLEEMKTQRRISMRVRENVYKAKLYLIEDKE